MNIQFAKEVDRAFLSGEINVTGVADWPEEDDEPLGTSEFKLLTVTDDSVIVRAGGDWQEEHVLELRLVDDGLKVTRDFGDRDVGEQPYEELEDACVSLKAFVSGAISEYDVAGRPFSASIETVTGPIDYEPLGYSRTHLSFLDGWKLVFAASGPGQPMLELTVGIVSGKSTVTKIEYVEDKPGFDGSAPVLASRFFKGTGVDNAFVKTLEDDGVLVGPSLTPIFEKLEGWPNVPKYSSDSEWGPYWKSSTAGDSSSWSSEDAIPDIDIDEAKRADDPVEVVTSTSSSVTVVTSGLVVVVGSRFGRARVNEIDVFDSTVATTSIKDAAASGKAIDGSDFNSDFLLELGRLVSGKKKWSDVYGWPWVPKDEKSGVAWRSVVSNSKSWPAPVGTSNPPSPKTSKPKPSKASSASGFSKKDVLEAALSLKQYYGQFKSAKQPSDLDLVKEAITMANYVTKLEDTIL